MFFDPPAALSAAALAGLGFDVEELLVVQTRGARRPRQRQPVGARAGAEERPRRCGRRLAAAAPARRSAAPPPARRASTRRPRLRGARGRRAGRPTASPLRLALQAGGADRLQVRVLKRRGPPLEAPLCSSCRPCCRRRRGGARAARASVRRHCTRPPSSTSRELPLVSSLRLALSPRFRSLPDPLRVLWVALHLPLLSLESFAATLAPSARPAPSRDRPVDEHRISAANAAAQAQGVKPGLKRATALALAPRITLGQADPARDAEAMLPLAHAALAFTPQVSLQPASEPGAAADTVLLEVQASLRYFGGIDRLLQRLQQASARSATRPHRQRRDGAGRRGPRRASSRRRAASTSRRRRQALADAPVWLLGPGREHWEALQGMGLRRSATCSACRAPAWRAASARRCWPRSTPPSAAVPIRASRSSRRDCSRAGSSCSPAPTAPSRCCTARRCCSRGWSPGWRRSMRSCAAFAC